MRVSHLACYQTSVWMGYPLATSRGLAKSKNITVILFFVAMNLPNIQLER